MAASMDREVLPNPLRFTDSTTRGWIGQAVLAATIVAGGIGMRWWRSSSLGWLMIFATIAWVGCFIRGLKRVPAESAILKLQLLQGLGLVGTGLGLLLNYGQKELERFGAAKPLFHFPDQPPRHNSEMKINFVQGNDGGWVMFLGIATDEYNRLRRDDRQMSSLCKGIFTKTPRRYQVLRKPDSATDLGSHRDGGGDPSRGTFEFQLANNEKYPCRVRLAWSDANMVLYEQEVELNSSAPHARLRVPSFKRPAGSVLMTLSEMFGIAEREQTLLPDRFPFSESACLCKGDSASCDRDRDMFYVASQEERANAAPCTPQNAGSDSASPQTTIPMAKEHAGGAPFDAHSDGADGH